MRVHDITRWQHSHYYPHGHEREGERRMVWVTWLAAAMMVAEIIGGWLTGSLALLADGWHMSTHALALGVGAFSFAYARRHAQNPAYSFGTGKVQALGSFASALLLAVVAFYVFGAAVERLWSPRPIAYGEAIFVAALGLAVNALSACVLHGSHTHTHANGEVHHDHGLRAAYAHVAADALTSLLAIAALLIGKFTGFARADALVGIVGAAIIAQWAWNLLHGTVPVLLDREPDTAFIAQVRAVLEADGDSQVADLHVWHVAPERLSAIVSVVAHAPREAGYYKEKLRGFDFAHITVEVNRCREHAA